MKKLAVIAIISVFLIFSSSIIHAQGYFPIWQYHNSYGQYNQLWRFQPYAPGYFSSFNPIGQYGQPAGFQSYIPGNFGSFNAITQPWNSQPRLSSESSSQFLPTYATVFPSIQPSLSSESSSPSWFNYAPLNYGPVFPSWQNWGSPSFYAEPPSTRLSPLGWRPEGPFYDLSEIREYSTPSNDPFHPNALWNLNWKLKNTDVSLENPDDGKSITIHKGETLGLILPNHRDIGIEWVLDIDEFDEGIIEKKSDDHYPGYFTGPRWAPQPVNGKEQWIFEAIGSGTTIIKMDLIDTTDELDTVSIKIEVKVI